MNNKIFDPFKSNENPPENCGYAMRLFKLNTEEITIEIKVTKSKHVETKIFLSSVKGILLSNPGKSIIKNKKNNSSKNIIDINKMLNSDYIPFFLLLDDGKLDLISPNYQTFLAFQNSIEELCNKKKNYSLILKYLEK